MEFTGKAFQSPGYITDFLHAVVGAGIALQELQIIYNNQLDIVARF